MSESRLILYVGSYLSGPSGKGGGIYALEWLPESQTLQHLSHCQNPGEAGYLCYAEDNQTLYCVDERKSDGRGPVNPPAAVFSFKVCQTTGQLTQSASVVTPGPRPTFLDYRAASKTLVSANHGDFQHVEKVTRDSYGHWRVEYIYDDSTVISYALNGDGSLAAVEDVYVFEGHGKDPNFSPQNGGHAQASPHSHCAVFSPCGRYVLACDKGTDQIAVFEVADGLAPVSRLQMSAETGPRHLAFDANSGLVYVTLEFASELASFRFDENTGALSLLQRVSTLATDYTGCNEPAEVRVHPTLGMVYVNNRGEDNLVWFKAGSEGEMTRAGGVSLAPSIHPGLAARSFTFNGDGSLLAVADRPAHLVHLYRVCPATGDLTWLTQAEVPEPAFIEMVTLPN